MGIYLDITRCEEKKNLKKLRSYFYEAGGR